MTMEMDVRPLKVKRDERGSVVEVLTTKSNKFKEVLLITSNAGAKRGGHFHKVKDELLCIISGKARVRFEDANTGEVKELTVDADKEPVAIRTPPNMVLTITTIGGSQLVLVELSDELYDEKPDTFKK